jgi:FSR family fosmidomycin resistance protein-like MFS transporter
VSGSRKGLGISIFTFGGSLGFALGPLAIIGAVQLVGLERSYYVMFPGLLAMLLVVVYLHIPREVLDRRTMPSLAAAFHGARWPMALLFSIAVLREFARLAVVTFLPIFLAMQGKSLVAGGITLSLFSLAGALGGMVGGFLSDHWSRKGVILTSGVVCVPLLHGIFHSDGWLSLAFLVLASATLSGANSVVIAFAQELVPSRAGTASSLVMGLGWGVAGLMLIGFGHVAELISVSRALDIAITVPLLAAVCAMALPAGASHQPAASAPVPQAASRA